MSVRHLQVPDQTRPPLSGTQSGQRQKVHRRPLREPQVRYAGQHPSVRDKKKDKYTVRTLQRRGETTTRSWGERSRNQERDAARWHLAFSPHSVSMNSEVPDITCMDLFYNDGNVLFMHLPIFKAESCGHKSAFNEKTVCIYICVCACYVLHHVCAVCMVVCTVCL